MKNPFEKALKAKRAKLARQAATSSDKGRRKSIRGSERAEEIRNGKVLSSTRTDKK